MDKMDCLTLLRWKIYEVMVKYCRDPLRQSLAVGALLAGFDYREGQLFDSACYYYSQSHYSEYKDGFNIAVGEPVAIGDEVVTSMGLINAKAVDIRQVWDYIRYLQDWYQQIWDQQVWDQQGWSQQGSDSDLQVWDQQGWDPLDSDQQDSDSDLQVSDQQDSDSDQAVAAFVRRLAAARIQRAFRVYRMHRERARVRALLARTGPQQIQRVDKYLSKLHPKVAPKALSKAPELPKQIKILNRCK